MLLVKNYLIYIYMLEFFNLRLIPNFVCLLALEEQRKLKINL